MVLFDESGTRTAAVGTYLFDVGSCRSSVRAVPRCVEYCIGKSGLRVGEGGFKFFVFGHNSCRNVDCGVGYLSIGVGTPDAA